MKSNNFLVYEHYRSQISNIKKKYKYIFNKLHHLLILDKNEQEIKHKKVSVPILILTMN